MATTEYNSTVAFLQDHAREALQEALNTRATIRGNPKPDLRSPNFSHTVTKPALQAPSASLQDFLPDLDFAQEQRDRLDGDINSWFTKYFPHVFNPASSLNMLDQPATFIQNILGGNSPYGLDNGDDLASWHRQIWHRSRDFAAKTRKTEEAGLYQAFSARGFSIPPGALVDLQAQARQRESEAVLEVNREESIRESEVQVEMLRFAMTQLVEYKFGVMDRVRQFMETWIGLSDQELERMRAQATAQSALFSALSSYYNVELGFEQLKLSTKQIDVGTDLDVDRGDIALFGQDNSSDALAAAVRGLADISAAAANASSSLVTRFG